MPLLLFDQALVARHAEEALGRAGIAEVLDFQLAQAALEAAQAVGLVAGQYGQVVDLLVALLARIQALRAHQQPVSEHKEIGVTAQRLFALEALEAVDMPAVVAELVCMTLVDLDVTSLASLGNHHLACQNFGHGGKWTFELVIVETCVERNCGVFL